MLKPETVDRAVAAIKRTADYEYFFDHLTSPEWIGPLHERGFFREPPGPEPEGNYVILRPWPESRYLARVAARAPEEVAQLILQMPDTSNARVIQDFVDAVLAMPVAVAKTLVPKAKEWTQSPYQLLLPDKLGDLVAQLAAGGEVDASLTLARDLLAVMPDPRREREPLLLPDAVARFEEWTYEHILEQHLPALVDAGGVQTLILLCDLLASAVKLSTSSDGRRAGYADSSYVWRPSVESSAQNIERDVKNVLVSSTRDAAERLVAADAAVLSDVVATLEAHRWDVCRRIALHVLRVAPAAAKRLLSERLTDPALVDDVAVHHEFWLLARDRFRDLSTQDRARLLSIIEAGPSRSRLRRVLREREGKRPAEADIEMLVKRWQLRRLTLLGPVLPGKWAKRRDAIASELGELENPEYPFYMGEMKTGPNSPKPAEDIAAMSVAELIAYLRDWQPSGEWMEPSPEGLGRELTKAVAINPKPYARSALAFRGVDPTYVRAVIQGFEQALKDRPTFGWRPVLDLSAWVVAQPREPTGDQTDYADADPGWGWARNAIANLLSSAFEAKAGGPPFRYRGELWSVLLPLTDDPEPTPEYEDRYGGSNMGPATMSINTTRGEAIHAAVRYGLWVRRRMEKQRANSDLAAGFEAMPEVREVLDAHLDPQRDPALAIRAVYGQWLPWLILLDRAWVERNLTAIFPWDSDGRLALVAWDTYIAFNQAYESSLELLRTEYARALDRLGHGLQARPDVADPDVKLAHHLMVFYWQGKLGLEEDGLVDRFFTQATDVMRGHALDFVGRSLKNTEGDVPEEVLGRLRKLWIRELHRARQSGGDQNQEELAAFGWWFSSGKFDDEWALEQLTEALRLGRKTDYSHMVAERLATIASRYPRHAVKVLSLLIGADDRIGVMGWDSQAKEILAAALRGTDPQARDEAQHVINLLGAKRYSDFGELLRNFEGKS